MVTPVRLHSLTDGPLHRRLPPGRIVHREQTKVHDRGALCQVRGDVEARQIQRTQTLAGHRLGRPLRAASEGLRNTGGTNETISSKPTAYCLEKMICAMLRSLEIRRRRHPFVGKEAPWSLTGFPADA